MSLNSSAPARKAASTTVPVSPTADLRHFSSVQILTRPHAANVRAQVP